MDDVHPLGPAGGAPTDPEAGLPADAGPSACLAVDRLRAGFGDLLAEPLGTLPDHRVREVTESSYQLLQSAQAGFLRAVAELDTRPGAVAGARAGQTAKTFLVNRLRRRVGQAGADVTAARSLRIDTSRHDTATGDGSGDPEDYAAGPGPLDAARRLPRLGAALAAGYVSREHVDVAVRAMRRIPTHLLTSPLPAEDETLDQSDSASADGESDGQPVTGRDLVEDRLLDWSRRFRPDETQRLADRLLAILDPDGAGRFDPDAEARRQLTVVADSTGMVGIHGWISAAPGALLIALIDHYSAPFPTRTEQAPDGRTVTITDTRTAGQRRADAFTRIIYDAASGVIPLTTGETSRTDRNGENLDEASEGTPQAREDAEDAHLKDTTPETQGDLQGLAPEGLVPDCKTRGGEPPRIVVTATVEQIREAFARARAYAAASTGQADGGDTEDPQHDAEHVECTRHNGLDAIVSLAGRRSASSSARSHPGCSARWPATRSWNGSCSPRTAPR